MDGKRIFLPLSDAEIDTLQTGDRVLLNGEMIVARDAAHRRWNEALSQNGKLPLDLNGATVYYMGPSPARAGRVIGSAGPTTATRMDCYTPVLLQNGLKGMVGKGRRSPEVVKAIVRHHAVYFAAIGGCGALLSKSIVSSETVAYEDLGAEAVLRITVRDFPCIVAVDCRGRSVYGKMH